MNTDYHDTSIVGGSSSRLAMPEWTPHSPEFNVPSSMLNDAICDSDYWGPRFMVIIAMIWMAGVAIGFQSALALLVIFGFLAAVVGLVWPSVGLFGVGIICTVDALMRTFLLTGGLLRWNTFNYWLLIVIVLGLPIILRAGDSQTWWIRLFLGLLICELFESPSVDSGINHILSIATVFGLQIYFIRASADERACYWLGMVTGTVSAIGGLLYFLQKSGLPRIDENAFSYFPLTGLFGICLAFPSAVIQRRGVKVLGILAMISSCWLLLIGSRGGMFVGVLCLSFLVSTVPGQGRRFTLLACTAFVLLGVTSLFAEMREKSLGRVTRLFDSERSSASRTSGRSDLAYGAWIMFCRNPLGVGTGGFPKNWARISVEDSREFSGYKRGKEQSCHSAWMKTLAENGIPGFVLLAAYVYSFFSVGSLNGRREMFYLGALTSASLALAFISTEFAGKGLWLLAAGSSELLKSNDWMPRGSDPDV